MTQSLIPPDLLQNIIASSTAIAVEVAKSIYGRKILFTGIWIKGRRLDNRLVYYGCDYAFL